MGLTDLQWPLFVGCLLIAFGPLLVFFFRIVAQRAQLVIICITAAFVWLVSILVAATLWKIIRPLEDSARGTIPVSVLIQEIFRALLFYGYVKAEQSILKMSTNRIKLPLNDMSSAFAAGIGFAAMQSTMIYGSVLASSLADRGAAFSESCSDLPVVFFLALLSLAFTILHIALMITAFEAYRRVSLVGIAFVGAVHMGASLGTLFNISKNGCHVSLPLAYVAALVASLSAWYTLRHTSSLQRYD